MVSEKEFAKNIKKKVKSNFKEQVKLFDTIKGMFGTDVERQKNPMEFENMGEFVKYVREYIKRNNLAITRYSNKILMLNESESEVDIMELYGILNGFTFFLMIKGGLKLTKE